MEKIFPRLCKGEVDESESDYYAWKLPLEGCILGSKFTYRRKIAENECLNGDYFDKLISFNYCQCTEEDWECDVGFSRDSEGICIRKKKQELFIPENCEDNYIITSGYRKVAGDVCMGGVYYNDIVIPCPNNKNYRTIISFLGIFILLIILYTFRS